MVSSKFLRTFIFLTVSITLAYGVKAQGGFMDPNVDRNVFDIDIQQDEANGIIFYTIESSAGNGAGKMIRLR